MIRQCLSSIFTGSAAVFTTALLARAGAIIPGTENVGRDAIDFIETTANISLATGLTAGIFVHGNFVSREYVNKTGALATAGVIVSGALLYTATPVGDIVREKFAETVQAVSAPAPAYTRVTSGTHSVHAHQI